MLDARLEDLTARIDISLHTGLKFDTNLGGDVRLVAGRLEALAILGALRAKNATNRVYANVFCFAAKPAAKAASQPIYEVQSVMNRPGLSGDFRV